MSYRFLSMARLSPKVHLVLLLLLAVQVLCLKAIGQDCSKVASDYRNSVVSISVEKTKKETGVVTSVNGTGFIVSPDGYVLTARHVVSRDPDTDEIRIHGAVGGLYAPKTLMRLVAEDKSSDVALLQFRDTSRMYTPVILGNPWKVKPGTFLCSLSFSAPLDEDYHATTGTLSSRTGQDEAAVISNLWMTQMPSNYGESGAPVIDIAQGGVVALKYGGRDPAKTQNVNYLIPINLADPMLRTHIGITIVNSESGPPDSDASLRLEKVSGDQQVIPPGGWKEFAVKVVDAKGKPVAGAKVAWQTPVGGALTYIGETDGNGISKATNIYTFPASGPHIQFATIVRRDTPVGFTQAGSIVSVGPLITFTFTQR